MLNLKTVVIQVLTQAEVKLYEREAYIACGAECLKKNVDLVADKLEDYFCDPVHPFPSVVGLNDIYVVRAYLTDNSIPYAQAEVKLDVLEEYVTTENIKKALQRTTN